MPSKPDAEIGSNYNASENRRRLERVYLISFRSPNDQQQVFAPRSSHVDSGGNPRFVDFNH
jgi:hypothetical protein